MEIAIRDRWAIGIEAAGRYLHPVYGVDVKANADGSAVGGYVTKVQEGDWTVAQEMLRGDVKTARAVKGRVPFQILANHYQTGDVTDWLLWQEFTGAVKIAGKRSIPVARMTPGLRKEIIGDDAAPVLSDEQLAAVEVGGELIALLPWRVWAGARGAGLAHAVLEAGEAGGLDAINVLLGRAGLGQAAPPGDD